MVPQILDFLKDGNDRAKIRTLTTSAAVVNGVERNTRGSTSGKLRHNSVALPLLRYDP
jgi:hypothetical protein